MKKLLWRPSRISWQIHLVIAIVAIIGLVLIESARINVKQPYYKKKVEAARIMQKGMDAIKRYRQKNIGPIRKKYDPLKSGLIGRLSTPITSSSVDRDAKLVTINPNWAAVVVHMFKKARLKNGDSVAISFTGSFPAMNLAVLSAAKAMEINPIIITSLASSTWGANIPGLTWLDMEEALEQSNLFPYRSIAASLGGVKDNALGIEPSGILIMKKTIALYGIPLLKYEDLKENIDARMALYYGKAEASPISAYMNVGGGTVAVGTFIGKRRFKPGLNLRPPYKKSLTIDSIMTRFAKQGLPVINMNYIVTLANKYGLPTEQKAIQKIGEGEIYYRHEYNNYLVVGVLLVLLIMLYLFIKQGFGHRIFSPVSKVKHFKPPEHMV